MAAENDLNEPWMEISKNRYLTFGLDFMSQNFKKWS